MGIRKIFNREENIQEERTQEENERAEDPDLFQRAIDLSLEMVNPSEESLDHSSLSATSQVGILETQSVTDDDIPPLEASNYPDILYRIRVKKRANNR